jgi:NAD(P)-dependent dehydrogenase (short-subunit alcohol dehydrogenase family)
MLLAGKTAAISGAAGPRGIGFATARTFAGQGARVAIVDIDGKAAAEAAAQHGKVMSASPALLFLSSALSAYTTGAVIDVNGGMHIH